MTRTLLTADRLAMAGLAALSALLYLVNLTVSGYANTYYAMAAQAGSTSWSAWFFGSLDSSGFITLDKPPLATMLMGLSVRVLGLSPGSVLLPQALLGVATVLVLFLAVRRSFGSRAAALAGLLMALTPVSVLIFRYDNPDALLTFLLVSAAWALGRGLEGGRIRWAVLASALVGAAFMTKFLQAWFVLPVFALVWLVSAPGSVRRRLAGLAVSAVTAVVASGWWVAVVELIPASARPYIGGSTGNSALELLLGYDGLGRIFGEGIGGGRGTSGGLPGGGFGPGGGPGGGPSFGGDPGLLRMLNPQFGGDIGWFVPAALLATAVVAVALVVARPRRTDPRVAGALTWGGWLAVHLGVFSLMAGIIHPYYTVALAPGVVALVAAGAVTLWDHRAASWIAGPVLGLGVFLTGATAWVLLERTPDFVPGLGVAAFAVSAAAGLALAIPPKLLDRRVARAAVALAIVGVLAGPAAYSVATMRVAHDGGDPKAGPSSRSSGIGGALGAELGADRALAAYLVAERGGARWLVAVSGSALAASLQLATGEPVMAMGGFNGGDPAPTVDELRAYVASGELRFVLEGGYGPDISVGPGGADTGDRTAWLESACTVVTVPGSTSGATIYDCLVHR